MQELCVSFREERIESLVAKEQVVLKAAKDLVNGIKDFSGWSAAVDETITSIQRGNKYSIRPCQA